jgi:hypothetical protein
MRLQFVVRGAFHLGIPVLAMPRDTLADRV